MSAQLVGTNSSERDETYAVPGYNQTIEVGEFHPNGFENALSKIGGKVFQFRLNENKIQNKLFFANKILCEEIFEDLSVRAKGAVNKTVKNIFLNTIKK
jgi:hypothetical protein